MTLTLNRLGKQRTVDLTVQSSAVPTPQVLSAEVQDRLAQATLQWVRARPGSPEADSAAAALEQLAREYPGSAPIQHNVGLLFETRDQLGEAIRRYRRAVELEPDAALFHFSLGEALQSIGNFNRALEELNTVVKLAPGVPIFTRCLYLCWPFS